MSEHMEVNIGQTILVYGRAFVVTGIDVSAAIDGMSMKLVGCDPDTANKEHTSQLEQERDVDEVMSGVRKIIRTILPPSKDDGYHL